MMAALPPLAARRSRFSARMNTCSSGLTLRPRDVTEFARPWTRPWRLAEQFSDRYLSSNGTHENRVAGGSPDYLPLAVAQLPFAHRNHDRHAVVALRFGRRDLADLGFNLSVGALSASSRWRAPQPNERCGSSSIRRWRRSKRGVMPKVESSLAAISTVPSWRSCYL